MKVSVIIPVYNAKRFVERAVVSALNQPEVGEVILIDDGSTDGSSDICKELEKSNSGVHYFQHINNKNLGAGASRNLGLQKVDFNFIAFLDADDYFLPKRFEATMRVFERCPHADGVYEAIGCHFESENLKKNYLNSGLSEITTVSNPGISPSDLFYHLCGIKSNIGYFSLNGLTIKKKAISKLDRMFDESLSLHQDTDFIYRLSYYCKLVPGKIDNPIALRTVHASNRITSILDDRLKESFNRVKMYEVLSNWARSEGLPVLVRSNFEGRMFAFSLRKFSKYIQLWKVGISVLKRNKYYTIDNVKYTIFRILQEESSAFQLFVAKSLEKLTSIRARF